MAHADMKLLRQQLNDVCTRALESGAGTCINRTHYEITVEHMLAPLLDMGSNDLMCIFDACGVDVSSVRSALNRYLDELKVGNSGRPQFSPFLAEWLSEGYQIAALELSLGKIRSGALLLALLRDPNRAFFTDYTKELAKIKADEVKEKFATYTANSTENAGAGAAEGGAPAAGAGAAASTGEALQQFTYDLTDKARQGNVDPVIGRETEIRRCVDILMRRFQNNPMIIGEPGTGKTAIIEGLALRIAAGDVPPFLQDITLLSLDVGLLSAGASVKGEFERRLKAVIHEVNERNAAGQPIILFIDEAHTLVGGGQGTDAAQLLKPALARGELRTIAATTFSEYKKYIEKDAPFAQRFGVIKLDEPSVPVCIDMLRGTKDKFEKHHNVRILDDAVRAAVSMSNQYLSEAQLPRKAVSLLDTACARIAVNLNSTPGSIEDTRRRIIQLEVALRAMRRDQEAGENVDPDEIAAMDQERETLQAEFDAAEQRWKEERELAQEVVKLRQELEVATADAAEGQEPAEGEQRRDPDTIRKELDEQTAKLTAFVGDDDAMINLQVDANIVAQVLSDWTGIPTGSMVKDQAEAILNFESRIGQRVIGQDHAMSEIGKRLRIAGSKMQDPGLPLAVFMLVGPSGTGKTETALAVADLIFGGERFMTTINMTEYSSSMNVSRLIGSAPGLVGFGEGGVLTEAVRQRPYSVVLLDEMEKAHMDVNLLFMQVFDKGWLTDSEGRKADFKNTVIMMTSNEGSDMIMDMCADGEMPTLDEMRKAIQSSLEQRFTPAFVGRTTVIPYYPLSQDVLRKIVDLKMNKIRKRLQSTYKVDLELTQAVGDEIGRRCQQITIGARLINLIINETVLPDVSRKVLEIMGSEAKYNKLVVDVADHEFTYEWK